MSGDGGDKTKNKKILPCQNSHVEFHAQSLTSYLIAILLQLSFCASYEDNNKKKRISWLKGHAEKHYFSIEKTIFIASEEK